MVSVDYPTLSRDANAVLLKDFAIHGQNPNNAYGDMGIGYGLDILGQSRGLWHNSTPITGKVARGLGVVGLPLLNGFYEADFSENRDFFLPADPNDPSKGYRRANMWYDPSETEKKPWVLGADLTLYVQPHLEFRWGPAFAGHAHGVPISITAKIVHNRVTYVGVDPLGRPGRQVIARGTRLTNREAQFLEQMVRFGATPIHGRGESPNVIDIAFGAYATEPPWRLATTPLLYKLGLSNTGPDWWRANAFGRVLAHPAPEKDIIQTQQIRIDLGTEFGAGFTVLPVAGPKSIKAAMVELEDLANTKDAVPVDIPADPIGAAVAAGNKAAAQSGLAGLADLLTLLQQQAGGQGAGQWPGSAEGQTALNAIRAAGRDLTRETTERLIRAMNALKAESGGSLPLDTHSALGNMFWHPGKTWMPDQVDAAISLFSADIAQQQPPQQLPPASPPQLPPAP
jgi:hypothetical protein